MKVKFTIAITDTEAIVTCLAKSEVSPKPLLLVGRVPKKTSAEGLAEFKEELAVKAFRHFFEADKHPLIYTPMWGTQYD